MPDMTAQRPVRQTLVVPQVLALLAAALAVGTASPRAARMGPELNGTIRGRVELRQPQGDVASRPNVNDVSMSRAHAPTDRRRSVVYLETAPRAAFDQREEPRAKLDQRNEAFVPHVLAIVAGTTVDFPNNDTTYHNVFSLSPTKSFDLGRYAVGRSKSVKFDRPGIVRVFCDIHSHMSATVMVFNHPWYAVPDENGNFQLPAVPSGSRQITAWHERLGDTTLPVSIDMEFVLPVPVK